MKFISLTHYSKEEFVVNVDTIIYFRPYERNPEQSRIYFTPPDTSIVVEESIDEIKQLVGYCDPKNK